MLAEALERSFIDTDQQIQIQSGKPIGSIFESEGEAAFRSLERDLVLALAAGAGSVVACGGGTLLDPDVRQAVEASSSVVFLDCEVDELFARLDGQPDRPLLAGKTREKLGSLMRERASLYRSFPERVDTSGRDPASVAALVMKLIDPGAVRSWQVRQPPRSYTMEIGSGLLGKLPDELAARNIRPPFVVITDNHVEALYAADIARTIGGSLITHPAGEASKTLEMVERIGGLCLERGLDRSGTVVSVGGGVVSDLAGFVAAIFMRGVQWVALPTTLLAMVDASLGGKVGIDLASGKNLIGAFHPPILVSADTDTLNSLPDEELRAGMAELIKAGLVGDPLLFEWLEADGSHPTVRWLERALAVKVSIVERDPHERGERAALNLGHTVGHALERATGYAMRHGDAVAVGLVAEARMAESVGLAEFGLAERIENVLTRFGLPVRMQGVPIREIIQAMAVDKKRLHGETRFSLPIRPGLVRIGCTIPEAILVDVIHEVVE